jgi:hypothetical protein
MLSKMLEANSSGSWLTRAIWGGAMEGAKRWAHELRQWSLALALQAQQQEKQSARCLD